MLGLCMIINGRKIGSIPEITGFFSRNLIKSSKHNLREAMIKRARNFYRTALTMPVFFAIARKEFVHGRKQYLYNIIAV
jgi:hypothetical protein